MTASQQIPINYFITNYPAKRPIGCYRRIIAFDVQENEMYILLFDLKSAETPGLCEKKTDALQVAQRLQVHLRTDNINPDWETKQDHG